jgi:hypothetical protein
MSTAKRLALMAVGYAIAVAGGHAAVAVNELFMPADIAQGSPGMVAFGDMVLLVLVAGFLSLVPTWFVLKLSVEKAPRALLAAEPLIAGLGPASWLAVVSMASAGPPPNVPHAAGQLFGLFIAFVAIRSAPLVRRGSAGRVSRLSASPPLRPSGCAAANSGFGPEAAVSNRSKIARYSITWSRGRIGDRLNSCTLVAAAFA